MQDSDTRIVDVSALSLFLVGSVKFYHLEWQKMDVSTIILLLLAIYLTSLLACLIFTKSQSHHMMNLKPVLCSQPVVAGRSLVIVTINILKTNLTPICNPVCVYFYFSEISYSDLSTYPLVNPEVGHGWKYLPVDSLVLP